MRKLRLKSRGRARIQTQGSEPRPSRWPSWSGMDAAGGWASAELSSFHGDRGPPRKRRPPHPTEGGARGPSWPFSAFEAVVWPELCSPVGAVAGRDVPGLRAGGGRRVYMQGTIDWLGSWGKMRRRAQCAVWGLELRFPRGPGKECTCQLIWQVTNPGQFSSPFLSVSHGSAPHSDSTHIYSNSWSS